MKCINPENTKNCGEKERIEWRHPGCRTRLYAKPRAESVPHGARMSNVTGFEEKRKHADGLAGMLVYVIQEISHSEEKRDCKDDPKRSCCCPKGFLHICICRDSMHGNMQL